MGTTITVGYELAYFAKNVSMNKELEFQDKEKNFCGVCGTKKMGFIRYNPKNKLENQGSIV